MTRYITQIRVIKLPERTTEPDRWSSATSTMTLAEASVPFDADDEAVIWSQPYLDSVTRALALLADSGRPVSRE